MSELEDFCDRVGLKIEMATGACPVQLLAVFSHGDFLEGTYLYFRARGDSWSIAIGGQTEAENDDIWMEDAPGFYREGTYGQPRGFDAGYMPMDAAARLIEQSMLAFRSREVLRLAIDPANSWRKLGLARLFVRSWGQASGRQYEPAQWCRGLGDV